MNKNPMHWHPYKSSKMCLEEKCFFLISKQGFRSFDMKETEKDFLIFEPVTSRSKNMYEKQV